MLGPRRDRDEHRRLGVLAEVAAVTGERRDRHLASHDLPRLRREGTVVREARRRRLLRHRIVRLRTVQFGRRVGLGRGTAAAQLVGELPVPLDVGRGVADLAVVGVQRLALLAQPNLEPVLDRPEVDDAAHLVAGRLADLLRRRLEVGPGPAVLRRGRAGRRPGRRIVGEHLRVLAHRDGVDLAADGAALEQARVHLAGVDLRTGGAELAQHVAVGVLAHVPVVHLEDVRRAAAGDLGGHFLEVGVELREGRLDRDVRVLGLEQVDGLLGEFGPVGVTPPGEPQRHLPATAGVVVAARGAGGRDGG
jgi:hypothetical protein